MGQKIHPTGFRLAVTRNWGSKWFANSKNYAGTLAEDIKVREYLGKKLSHASVSKVTIERPAKNARITIHSARPGVVIGKKGEDIETLRGDLRKMMGGDVGLNIEEIRKPEIDAQLVADSIAQQLEKRIMFRRAMKRAMQNAMRLGAQGIKVMSSGRLNGAEIARREWYREGRVPLHTLRADIDYGFAEARTTYGVIGIKVWVFKGEVMQKNEQPVIAPAVSGMAPAAATPAPAPAAPAPAAPAAATDKPKKPRRAPAKPRAGAKNAATSKT
jgi:small subunit ribosomal protein S3